MSVVSDARLASKIFPSFASEAVVAISVRSEIRDDTKATSFVGQVTRLEGMIDDGSPLTLMWCRRCKIRRS